HRKAAVNRLMEQISHVHSLQLVLLALHELQPVFQEMRVGAGRILLQTGHAALEKGTVKGSGRRPSNSPFLIGIEGRLRQSAGFLPPSGGTVKIPEYLQK